MAFNVVRMHSMQQTENLATNRSDRTHDTVKECRAMWNLSLDN